MSARQVEDLWANLEGALVPVPRATYLAPEDQCGRIVGRVVSRVMLGIMLFPPALTPAALAMVAAAAILLNFCVFANLVFSQRANFALDPERRSRIHGPFMALFFAGGAVGSALGGWSCAALGWPGSATLGAALPVIGLLYLSTEGAEARASVSCERKT